MPIHKKSCGTDFTILILIFLRISQTFKFGPGVATMELYLGRQASLVLHLIGIPWAKPVICLVGVTASDPIDQ